MIGGGHFAVMAGPCSVETPEQVIETAKACKEAGATILRGGAFKPRTSPYSFQGMGPEGLELLELAKKKQVFLSFLKLWIFPNYNTSIT